MQNIPDTAKLGLAGSEPKQKDITIILLMEHSNKIAPNSILLYPERKALLGLIREDSLSIDERTEY